MEVVQLLKGLLKDGTWDGGSWRREEKKIMLFGWRLQRIVRKVVALLNECRGWWAEYCGLKRKFVVEGKLKVVGLCTTWRNCMRIFMRKDGRRSEREI